MHEFNNAYYALGLVLNVTKKFKYSANRTRRYLTKVSPITVGGQKFKNVATLNYTGSTLSANANIDAEIDQCLQVARIVLAKLQTRVFNEDICKDPKMKVYAAMVLLTLLHGCETWVTYSHNAVALEKFCDCAVRNILSIKWQNFHTINRVSAKVQTTSIDALVIRNQLRWSDYVARTHDSCLPKRIMYAELEDGKQAHRGQRMQVRHSSS